MAEGRLKGRTALVTGGAIRLGRAIALHLAEAGADVAIHYCGSREAARDTLAELTSRGARCVAVQGDFANDPIGAARTVFAAAVQALGPIDLLVNSAAIFAADTLATLQPDGWDRHLHINLAAPVWLTQELARRLPRERRGDVINILDWRAARPQPGHLAYTVAKAGLAAATRLLALELAPHIRVNAIAPGAILPPPGATAADFERTAAAIPLGRTGEPADICEAVEFLATAKFVTGELLHVTGGQQL